MFCKSPMPRLEVGAFRESQEVHMDDDDDVNDNADVDELEEEILMGRISILRNPVYELLPDLSFHL
jgi:hypothetical protein